jgi:hypothetical protein
MAGIQPPAPALYADVLWNTALAPATSPVTGRAKTVGLPASINGIAWAATDPETKPDFIAEVNRAIGIAIYGAGSAWNCELPGYPFRYVVMHSIAQGSPPVAHELQVANNGTSTYLTTDWRIPPDYNSGGL